MPRCRRRPPAPRSAPELGRVEVPARDGAPYGGPGDGPPALLEGDPAGHLLGRPLLLEDPRLHEGAQGGVVEQPAPAAAQPPGVAPALGGRGAVPPPSPGVAIELPLHGRGAPADLPGHRADALPLAPADHYLLALLDGDMLVAAAHGSPLRCCLRKRHRSARHGPPRSGGRCTSNENSGANKLTL